MLLTSNLTLLLCLRINLRYFLPLDNLNGRITQIRYIEFEEYATLKTNKKPPTFLFFRPQFYVSKFQIIFYNINSQNKSVTSKACVSREGLIKRKIK